MRATRPERQDRREIWALHDVSLEIAEGEAVGIIGRNGSGKSTLLKLIAGIYRPTSGRLLVRRDARIGTMIELGGGFHPELSGRENVYLNASVYGLDRTEVDRIYDAVASDRNAYSTANEAIKAIQAGAYDYIAKPFNVDEVLVKINRWFGAVLSQCARNTAIS